jgi:hypothetical protein
MKGNISNIFVRFGKIFKKLKLKNYIIRPRSYLIMLLHGLLYHNLDFINKNPKEIIIVYEHNYGL